jgi:hypothetical protein
MRESIVRRRFPLVSSAFLNWADARTIVGRIEECRQEALQAYRHPRKIGAISYIIHRVSNEGFDSVKAKTQRLGLVFY